MKSFRNVTTMLALFAATVVFASCEPEENPDNGAGKPEAVMNLTATAGNGQVSLAWEEPSDNGGEEITAYELTADNWANKVNKSASELSHTYTGLTNGTQYTFKVRAVNANGAGAETSVKATPTVGSGDCWTELTNEMVRDGGTFPKCTYIVKGILQINNGKTLTFAPGTVILFDENQYHSQGGFQGLSASIVAKGTEQEPIIFTSAKENRAAGDWSTMQFQNCDFEWCTIEYGGSIMRDEFAFFMTGFSGSGSFKHCTLRESIGTGLNAAGVFTAFEHTTISSCGEWDSEYDYPMIVYSKIDANAGTFRSSVKALEAMGEGIVINTAKGVAMDANVLQESTTLHKLNCPYLFNSIYGLNVANCTLTIEPGVHLKIGESKYQDDDSFTVRENGVVIARGTAEDPIVIESTGSGAGYWGGVAFYSGRGAGCILEYCRILDAGYDVGGEPGDGAIEVYGYADDNVPIVTVRNCYIANSPTWGINWDEYKVCSQSGNTFVNCVIGNYPTTW
jgi:hypothetical protein